MHAGVRITIGYQHQHDRSSAASAPGEQRIHATAEKLCDACHRSAGDEPFAHLHQERLRRATGVAEDFRLPSEEAASSRSQRLSSMCRLLPCLLADQEYCRVFDAFHPVRLNTPKRRSADAHPVLANTHRQANEIAPP